MTDDVHNLGAESASPAGIDDESTRRRTIKRGVLGGLLILTVVFLWQSYSVWDRYSLLHERGFHVTQGGTIPTWANWLPNDWHPYLVRTHATDLKVRTDNQLRRAIRLFDVQQVTHFGTTLDSSKFTDEGIELLKHLPSLQSVTLSTSKVTDADLASLVDLPNLTTLTLYKTNHLTVTGVETLRRAPSLNRLALVDWHPQEAWKIMCRLPQTYVWMGSADPYQLTDADFNFLTEPVDTEVGFSGSGRPNGQFKLAITEQSLPRLKNLKGLHYLDMQGLPITDKGLEFLSGITTLEMLKLDETQISDDGLETLTRSSRLDSLSLRNTNITDAGLRHIAKCSSITVLRLNGCDINMRGVELLQSLPNLQLLDLTDCPLKGEPSDEPLDFPNIDELILSGSGIQDEQLDRFKKIAPASQQELATNNAVSNGQAAMAAYFGARERAAPKPDYQLMTVDPDELLEIDQQQLWSLDLSGTAITDEGLQGLGSNPYLCDLNLSQTGITDDGIANVKFPIPHPANRISVNSRLDLSGTKITDAAIQHLIDNKQHKRITRLDLSHTAITDEGVQLLMQFPRLKERNLSHTKTTQASRQSL